MARRRFTNALLLGGGILALLVTMTTIRGIGGDSVVGAARGVTSGGCEEGLPVVEEGDIRVASRFNPQNLHPTTNAQAPEIVAGEYLIKLVSDPTHQFTVQSGRLITNHPTLSLTLDRLDPKDISVLHPDLSDKAREAGLNEVLRLRTDLDPLQVDGILATDTDVEWFEPVYVIKALGTPNDPYYPFQWDMSTLGMPSAWGTANGTGVIVAVVDTGVSAGNDGFAHLLAGYDFVDDDTNAADANGHGTHVAGTIAQATNNSRGVSGIAYGASILPVRVLDADGSGTSPDVASGIRWAADHGAKVINMSLGAPTSSLAIEQACDYAWDMGVLVVAASGNDGNASSVSYPAAGPSTVAVGATDLNSVVTYYSNKGEGLDLVAPGGDNSADLDGDGYADGILQETVVDGEWNYYFYEGTSMATPHVAGVAALLYSKGATSPDEVLRALTTTAQDLGAAGYDTSYGYGIIDPVAALQYDTAAPAVEITAARARRIRPSRSLLTWTTSLPADAEVLTSTGVLVASATTFTTSHRFTLRGEANTQVAYEIVSTTADGAEDTATINVRF